MAGFEEWPLREAGLLLSIGGFALVSVTLLIARQVNGQAPPVLRWALLGLWLYAALRLYSASSFVWGGAATDAGIFPVLRMAVFVMVTLLFIVGLALFGYYWRRWRSRPARD